MKKFFMAVIAIMMTMSVSAQFYIYLSNGEVLQADSISMVAPIPGTLYGEFSVSETTKVHFSKGNLQYVGTWQFAENQWDVFYDSQSENHRDLFGWGTGDAPNKESMDDSDYATFNEWGVNPITNGGNESNIWRTLTSDEWKYLFYERANAALLFGFGTVNGIDGTIVLPDNWVLPTGASFATSTEKGLSWNIYYYYNNNQDNFSHNTYTAEQWSVMESAGAVFLPSTGFRKGMDVGNQPCGYYWSAKSKDTSYALSLFFNWNSLYPVDQQRRNSGRSVRLVR